MVCGPHLNLALYEIWTFHQYPGDTPMHKLGPRVRTCENVRSIYGVSNADPSPGKGNCLIPEPSAFLGCNSPDADVDLRMHRLS